MNFNISDNLKHVKYQDLVSVEIDEASRKIVEYFKGIIKPSFTSGMNYGFFLGLKEAYSELKGPAYAEKELKDTLGDDIMEIINEFEKQNAWLLK